MEQIQLGERSRLLLFDLCLLLLCFLSFLSFLDFLLCLLSFFCMPASSTAANRRFLSFAISSLYLAAHVFKLVFVR